MLNKQKNNGFSLIEVLMALATLTIGMLLIAGVFPVALHFSTISTERTISAVVADEAFAKIKLIAEIENPIYSTSASDFEYSYMAATLYQSIALGPSPYQASFRKVVNYKRGLSFPRLDPEYFAYPSDPEIDISKKQYFWSAICRKIGSSSVMATVFISRKTGSLQQYHRRDPSNWSIMIAESYPVPIYLDVSGNGISNELIINDIDPLILEETFINEGYTIIDDTTGQSYRVTERYHDFPNTIVLDQDWPNRLSGWTGRVWLIPPGINGGRNPCIAVYQKVINL